MRLFLCLLPCARTYTRYVLAMCQICQLFLHPDFYRGNIDSFEYYVIIRTKLLYYQCSERNSINVDLKKIPF